VSEKRSIKACRQSAAVACMRIVESSFDVFDAASISAWVASLFRNSTNDQRHQDTDVCARSSMHQVPGTAVPHCILVRAPNLLMNPCPAHRRMGNLAINLERQSAETRPAIGVLVHEAPRRIAPRWLLQTYSKPYPAQSAEARAQLAPPLC
jgi:hypothetical protein